MNAIITDFKRFAIHDGPGIRTTVFFKGCSLRCVWCHNPETLSSNLEVAFYKEKCQLCGKCSEYCKNHIIENGLHKIDRKNCNLCRECVDLCPYNALVKYGEIMDTDEICNILLEDKDFYSLSGGGITLSGGECLLQFEACKEILKKMKQNGVHTAIDTAGFVKEEAFDAVIPYTDMFLYDIKAINSDIHIKYTGKSNDLILKNLEHIDSKCCNIEIRIPFIPECNSGEIAAISEYIKKLANVSKIKLLKYHNLSESKANALDMSCDYPKLIPNDKEIMQAKSLLESTGKPVEV